MTVLFLTPSFLPKIGGVERHLAAVGRELAQNGYNLTIVVGAGGATTDWPYGKIISLPSFEGPWRILKIWQWFWQNRRLWQQADLVHGHDFPTFYWVLPLRLFFPRPFYLTFHGWEGTVPPDQKTVLLRRLAERFSAGSIAAGHFIAKWYGQHPNFTTYGGVDASKIAAVKKQPKRAVFIGQLREDTGIRQYLAAFRELAARKLLTQLDIVGDGPLRGPLEELTKKDNLPVTFFGYDEPGPYLARARYAFISGYLGMLEAMAARAIVVATYDNPLKKDYLELSSLRPYIQIAESSAEIIREIRELEQQPALREQLSTDAREFACKQTWQRVSEVYEQLWLSKKLA